MSKITKLEVKGFKSFADKSEIIFGNKFNCVIGANGSGKSNISDMICFVLGRSSAKSMRAEKSANLIYNGGKKGDPAKEASVSIHFNNSSKVFPSPEKEISITRRIKQNGISIYILNGKIVTKQEILDLLNVARIDPNGHNIISQGDIIQFTEMKPVERRELLEGIAGISVYEDKKQKALLELNKVDVKLNEVGIVLRERGQYLDSLKKDRDQAIKYKQLEEDITRNKATLLHLRLKDMEEKEAGINSRIKKHNEGISKINEFLKELQEKINEKKSEIEEVNQKIKFAGEEGSSDVTKSIDGVKSDIARFESRIEVCNNEISRMKNKKNELKLNLKDNEDKINEINLEVKKLQEELQELKKEEASLLKSLGSFKEKNSIKDIQKSGNEINSIDERVSILREKLFDKNAELEKARINAGNVDDRLLLDVTTKKFLESKQEGVHGVVSGLGKVDSEYSTALNVAAGGRLKSVVVDSDLIAKTCIEYLKKNRLGVLTFLPLNKISPKSNLDYSKNFLKEDGVIDFAINLVSFDKKFNDVFMYVFGSTLVVKNLEVARKIGIGRARMVTLDGDLVETSGAMIGGYRGKSLGHGFQEKEIKGSLMKLEKEISSLKEEMDSLSRQREELKRKFDSFVSLETNDEAEDFENKRTALKEKILGCESNINSKRNEINHIYLREKQNLLQLVKNTEFEQESFEKELEEARQKLSEQKKELNKKEKEQKLLYGNYKELFEKKNRISEAIQKLEVQHVRNEDKINVINDKLHFLNEDKEKIMAEITGLIQEFEEFKDAKLKKSVSIVELNDQIRDFERMQKQMGNVNLKALEIYEKIEEEYEKILSKVEKLKVEKEDVLNMINEIELNKKSLFMKTFNVLNNNFKNTFSMLSNKGAAHMDVEDAENPFNAGVDIKVRLTNKKYLDINSLSGGEKTLAALAFIFAIQEYEPAPFYLFDEVDAALDKNNSELLSKLLSKYSETAQYIVISHNDAVITEAEQIYGVSMQDGVSKIVSLKV